MTTVRLWRSLIVSLVSGLMLMPWATASAAPGNWRSLAPVPARGTGVEGPFVAPVSTGEIVAAFGFDNGDTRRTRIYDIRSNTWRIGARAPSPPRSEGTAVSRGAFVYAIGGRFAGPLADLDRYDAFADRWISLADMPTPRAGLASARIEHEIYVLGGRRNPGGPCSGREVRAVERYDIRSNTWVRLAPLPTRRSDVAAAAVNGKIYVFGGCRRNPATGDVTFLQDVDVYSPETNSWSTAPRNLPRRRAAFYQVAARATGSPEPKVYAIGGWDGTGMGEATVFVYNVTTNTYTQATPMPTPRAEMGVANFRGRIYTVGGAQPAFGASVDAHEVFTPW
jgi:hypothetical protein